MDYKQYKITIPESRKTNKMSPKIGSVYHLERVPGYKAEGETRIEPYTVLPS